MRRPLSHPGEYQDDAARVATGRIPGNARRATMRRPYPAIHRRDAGGARRCRSPTPDPGPRTPDPLIFLPMPRASFDLQAPFSPAGDQPRAIAELTRGLETRRPVPDPARRHGSGKTMTVANVIQTYGRPTLVLSHNKTLAAQVYGELKSFFPRNAVEYFISYYDYYQPEAYVPTTDTYIEKDASINEDIDRLRLRATSSLMEREDVVDRLDRVGHLRLGDPETYRETMLTLARGQRDRAR